MKVVKLFPPVKRIAVIMYGQWRTASKLIEYQKEFYRSRYGVEIDIFADIKMDHTYLNTRFTADSEKAGLEDIEAGLKELGAVHYKIHTDDEIREVQKGDHRNYFGQHSTFLKAHHAKCMHEIENDFEYDIVIAQRPDAITWPVDYIDYLVGYINSLTNANCDSTFPMGASMHMIANLQCIDPRVQYVSALNDVFFWGTNLAIDLMAQVLKTTIKMQYDELAHDTYRDYDMAHYYAFHHTLPWALRKSGVHNITHFGYPCRSVRTDKKNLAFGRFNVSHLEVDKMEEIGIQGDAERPPDYKVFPLPEYQIFPLQLTVVRSDAEDLVDDLFSFDTHQKLFEHWQLTERDPLAEAYKPMPGQARRR